MTNPKRPRGRPPSPQGAKPRAEIRRAYRERRKAAGKALRVIDTWTTMTGYAAIKRPTPTSG